MMFSLVPSNVIDPSASIFILTVFPLRLDVILEEKVVSVRWEVLNWDHVIV
jgi:hypothetical protein